MLTRSCCLLCCLILAATVCPVDAAIITQWDFNTLDSNPGSGTSTPNIGAGSLTLVGGTAPYGFAPAQGSFSGDSSDPVVVSANDSSYFLGQFPAQSTGNKTAGIQFNVSTARFGSIAVNWDQRAALGAPMDAQFQYSLDGSSFVDFGPTLLNLTTWDNLRTRDLSSIAGVNNNPNFAFRIVATFRPSSNTYSGASSSSYNRIREWYFDMVTVSGNPVVVSSSVPEPASWILLGSGLAAVLAARRRRTGAAS